MNKREIILKIFLSVVFLVGALFLARYIYKDNQIEYRDLNGKNKQEELSDKQEEKGLIFSKAIPKNEEETSEDNRTLQKEGEAEKPTEITNSVEKDNISLGSENKNSNTNEIENKEKKDNIIIVPVRSTSSDGRIYIEYQNKIYEVSGISEKYLPIKKIAKEEINNYPVVYYDEAQGTYFIYTNISEIKFLKINEKYLDETTKTYKGKVEEFIL